MKRLTVILAILAAGAASAFAQTPEATPQAPREVTRPIERTVPLQIGETRIFQFGQTANRIDLSEDNIVLATSAQDNAFAFKGLKAGRVFVTSRSEDGSEVHRMQIVVGGHQVKMYTPDEPDYLGVNCDEFGCGPGASSKRAPRATTIRTPTGGGGFVERSYN